MAGTPLATRFDKRGDVASPRALLRPLERVPFLVEILCGSR